MNRIFVLLIALSFVFVTVAAAQEAPRVEVFGGYQLTRANSGISGFDNFNLNGWNASVSGYFNRYVGITSDFGGSYAKPEVLGVGVTTHLYTVMFGPTVRVPNKSPFQPFGHALFGIGRVSGAFNAVGFNFSDSDTGFAWAAGGGLDVKVLPLISIRPAQVDFLQTHIAGDTQNNFRYSAGVVIRF